MALGKPHAGTTPWHQCRYASVAECNEAWRQLSAARKTEYQARVAQQEAEDGTRREQMYRNYEAHERVRVAEVMAFARGS